LPKDTQQANFRLALNTIP